MGLYYQLLKIIMCLMYMIKLQAYKMEQNDGKVSDMLKNITNVNKLAYKPGKILNPFTKKYNKIIFADDTASGRPCEFIDNLINTNVLPYYSNTHSNATCGTMMKNLVNKTKDVIREDMNVGTDKKIIFNGSGCTGAVNHLVNKINFAQYSKICIHTSSYEHHSNFLPWRERLADHMMMYPETDIRYNYVDTDDDFNLLFDKYLTDLDLELSDPDPKPISPPELERNDNTIKRLDIFTLTGCSNVTGKRYDQQFKQLWDYVKLKKSMGHKMYLFIDYACSAPYVKIDLESCDGVFFSGHKFLGGQGTPGVLIVNTELLQTEHPYQPGGGCVDEANDQIVTYKSDYEAMETCGTPNISGIIRLGYVLSLKQSLFKIIEENERILALSITQKFRLMEEQYPGFKVIGLESRQPHDLPIYPIIIKGMHYNLVTVLLNDLSGIQTRGGLSCCGTLGRICKERFNINGWCRISFNYLMTRDQINKIFRTIEFILVNKKSLKKRYIYDKDSNMFHYNQNYVSKNNLILADTV